MRLRGRSGSELRRSLAVAGAVALVVSLLPQGASAQLVCDPAKPVLREANINQGLPYPSLVRGKKALARFYLSQASCAPSTQQMSVKAARLAVSNGIGTTSFTALNNFAVDNAPIWAYDSVYSPATATAPSRLIAPALTSHPLFAVDGRHITRSATEAGPITFTLSVDYVLGGVVRTVTFASVSKNVEKATQPLRVLQIPMGDTARDWSTQFPADAPEVALEGLRTVSRVMPVADGLASLRDPAGSAGVRYFLNSAGAVDVSINAAGKFCGSSTNYPGIGSRLDDYLVNWNTANAVEQRSDKVQGLIDESIMDPCASGMAALNGVDSWAGLFRRTALEPGHTGSVMTMEIGHNFGAVPALRDSAGDATHAQDRQADVPSGTAYLDRAHNIQEHVGIARDKNVMKYDSDTEETQTKDGFWNDSVTLFDANDWAVALCRLGGPFADGCATAVAANQTVVAEAVAVLVGITDGTPQGTDVRDSFVSSGPADQPALFSDYRLVQRVGTNVVSNVGVPTHPTLSVHRHDDENHAEITPRERFSVMFPFVENATRLELWKGAVNSGTLLWSTDRSAQPVISFFNLIPRGSLPIPCDPVENPVGCAVPTGPAEDVEFGPLANRITFEEEGRTEGEHIDEQYADLGVHFVDNHLVTPILGTPDDVVEGGPAETHTAPFALFNNEEVLGSGNYEPLVITFDEPQTRVGMYVGNDDSDQILARLYTFDSEGQRIEGVQKELNSDVDTFIGVDAGVPSISKVEVHYVNREGNTPAWPNEEIDTLMFERTVSPEVAIPDAVDMVAYLEDFLGESTGTDDGDVELPAAAGPPPLPGEDPDVYDAVVTATDDDARTLRASFFSACPDVNVPLAVSEPPASVDGDTATFEYAFDTTRVCTDGSQATLMVRVGDGFLLSEPERQSVEAEDRPPVAVVTTPRTGGTVLEHEAISLTGIGWDVSDPTVDLTWFLTGPGGTEQEVGNGPDVVVPAPDQGWAPGSYTARLVATDSGGRTAAATRTFEIAQDSDNDGVVAAKEACANGSDDNPWDGLRDGDGDGVANGSDEDPCVARAFYDMVGNFDPDNLFVPSSGTPVTMYVESTQRDLTTIDPTSVRLTNIGGTDVSSDPRFRALSWGVVNGLGVGKFDRQLLTKFLFDENMLGNVRITVGGRDLTRTWQFEATDYALVRDR